MNLLSNILIKPNVITKEGCKFLTDYMKTAQKEQMGVFDPDKTNETKKQHSKIDQNTRDVTCADLGPVLPEIEDLMKNIVHRVMNPYYNFKIRDSEAPQLLCYEGQGHYMPHIDGEALWVNPDGEKQWKKSIDRDMSAVLFLNGYPDFEGGDFVFPELRVVVRPEPGLLVTFPSTHEYKHGVEKVVKGNRYTMVTWFRVHGIPTKEEQDKVIADKYNIEVH